MLDTVGARELGFGDDVPYRAEAWERVDRGKRPEGDDLAGPETAGLVAAVPRASRAERARPHGYRDA